MYTGAMQQTISIFWQVPQYFFITLGEVLFCATGYEFSYAEVSCLVSSFFYITNTFTYKIVGKMTSMTPAEYLEPCQASMMECFNEDN